jgi:hypothetical protein
MVSYTFKSGTNQFHGALEDRYQNRSMYHRQYFEQVARKFRYNYHEGSSIGAPNGSSVVVGRLQW